MFFLCLQGLLFTELTDSSKKENNAEVLLSHFNVELHSKNSENEKFRKCPKFNNNRFFKPILLFLPVQLGRWILQLCSCPFLWFRFDFAYE